MPEISVIIPVYNAASFIEQAIDSVLSQTIWDYEIIVVDNGSTDGTLERIRKYGESISLLEEKRRGPAVCRNQALDVAQGSLIAFLDADDYWLSHKLERQVEIARKFPEYGIITTDVAHFNEEGVIRRSLRELYPIANGFVIEKLLFWNWISTSAAMVRTECIRRFDEEPGIHGTDWMMWMEIASQYQVYFIDEVLVHRRVHPDSFEHSKAENQFNNLFKNLNKLQSRIPQLAEKPELISEAAFRICLKRGWEDLNQLNIFEARRKLRRALQYKTISMQVLLLLSISYFPLWILSNLKKILRNLRRILGRCRVASRDNFFTNKKI